MLGNVHFITPGFIDLNVIRLMGVNVKKNDNPIGYFGTGLKFALATLMRNNIFVRIQIGDKEEYVFKTSETSIRDVSFNTIDMVCLKGPNKGKREPLAYTTDLGKNWELWMAFRELYSNTLDEGGICMMCKPTVVLSEDDKTIISIEHSIEFCKIFEEKHKYFLDEERTPILWEDENISIHEGTSDAIYYRGIKALNLTTSPSKYTYNIKTPTELTEDRNIKYSSLAQRYIREAFTKKGHTMPQQIIETMLGANKSLEKDFEWDCEYLSTSLSPEMLNLLEARITKDRMSVPARLTNLWKKQSKNTNVVYGFRSFTKHEEKVLSEALSFIESHEFGFVTSDYDIRMSTNQGSRIMGTIIRGLPELGDKDIIVLTPLAFQKGLRQLVLTLLEEHLHLSRHVLDETREMQDAIFEMMLDALLSQSNQIL